MRSLGLTLALLSLSSACRGPAAEAPPKTRPRPGLTKPKADPTYAGAGRINARHYQLQTRLDAPRAASFARTSEGAKRRLAALIQRSGRLVDAYAVADRLLISLSADHPGGPMEILVSDDLDRLFVFDDRRKRAVVLPRERLPDVLDATRGVSDREDYTGTITPAAGARPAPDSRLAATGIAANLGLRYRPPGRRANRWALRLNLEATGPDALERFPFQHPLYHLALPLLQEYRGLLVLESLTYAGPIPWRFRTTVTNETLGLTVVRWDTRVRDRGWIQLPAERFTAVRSGYRYLGQLWRPEAAGRQLQPKAKLAGLRGTSKPARLEIKNQAAHAALVYVDGAIVAWVAPGHELTVEGLDEGYYRLHAVSPTGVRAWGPRDSYVPGPLVLR